MIIKILQAAFAQDYMTGMIEKEKAAGRQVVGRSAAERQKSIGCMSQDGTPPDKIAAGRCSAVLADAAAWMIAARQELTRLNI